MFDIGILAFYSATMIYFCVGTLADKEEELSIIDWFFAIVLPVAVIVGSLGYPFFLDGHRTIAYVYLPIWAGGVMSVIWEIKDFQKVPGGFSLPNVIGGLLLMGIMFGPGLYLGWYWLRTSLA